MILFLGTNAKAYPTYDLDELVSLEVADTDIRHTDEILPFYITSKVFRLLDYIPDIAIVFETEYDEEHTSGMCYKFNDGLLDFIVCTTEKICDKYINLSKDKKWISLYNWSIDEDDFTLTITPFVQSKYRNPMYNSK